VKTISLTQISGQKPVTKVNHYVYWTCIIAIVEEQKTNLMSQFIKFYFTSSTLNMFRTLIHPSSVACDFSIVSPHWLCVLVSIVLGFRCGWVEVVSLWQAEVVFQPVSMCVGFSVWLRWGGIRVAG